MLIWSLIVSVTCTMKFIIFKFNIIVQCSCFSSDTEQLYQRTIQSSNCTSAARSESFLPPNVSAWNTLLDRFFFNCESINITDPNLPSYSHILGHNCSIVSHHLLYKCVYTFCFSLINCSCQNWSDLSLKSDLTPTTWFQKFKWE